MLDTPLDDALGAAYDETQEPMDSSERIDAFHWIARNLAWSRRLDELRAARHPTPVWVLPANRRTAFSTVREERVA